jgi:NAD(P)-dependent dehydrogenase (short-subunit alcohol dehydrogenase family)
MTRVAVVTGAAGGIGSATCDVLERQGWEVVGLDRRPIERAGSVQVDLADPDAVASALETLTRIDGLVNNAALQLHKGLDETELGEWDAVSAVNLRAPFVCIKSCRERLADAGGAVVNVASVHACATSRFIAAYAATKGGLMAFTRAAAVELAPDGIRVNAVLPGAVDTPALREGLSRSTGTEHDLVERTPMRRIGRPEEVGEAIGFLLDADRSGFITGHGLAVDGGALAALSTGAS